MCLINVLHWLTSYLQCIMFFLLSKENLIKEPFHPIPFAPLWRAFQYALNCFMLIISVLNLVWIWDVIILAVNSSPVSSYTDFSLIRFISKDDREVFSRTWYITHFCQLQFLCSTSSWCAGRYMAKRYWDELRIKGFSKEYRGDTQERVRRGGNGEKGWK